MLPSYKDEPESAPGRYPDTKIVYSGRSVRITQPRVEDIDLVDIAMGLAGINRYDGHTHGGLWNVCNHQTLCMMIAEYRCAPRDPVHEFDCGVHDCHEYVIGDLTTPTTGAFEIELPGFRVARKRITNRWDTEIYRTLTGERILSPHDRGDRWPDAQERAKVVDDLAYLLEKGIFVAMMEGETREGLDVVAREFSGMIPDIHRLKMLTRKQAALEWLERLTEPVEMMDKSGYFILDKISEAHQTISAIGDEE